jgi:dGTP triphosphohydrolase
MTNPIRKAIEERERTQLVPALPSMNEAELEALALQQQYHQECTQQLSEVVRWLKKELNEEKQRLLTSPYPLATLKALRQRCSALSEELHSMVENKRNRYFQYMYRNPVRRHEAQAARNRARQVVEQLDRMIDDQRKYIRSRVEDKLFELITALENLDPIAP